MTEDTNHLTLVGLEKGHKGQNLTQCRTLKANSSNSWQMGGNERTDTLFVTSGENKGVVPYDQFFLQTLLFVNCDLLKRPFFTTRSEFLKNSDAIYFSDQNSKIRSRS